MWLDSQIHSPGEKWGGKWSALPLQSKDYNVFVWGWESRYNPLQPQEK